MAPHPISICQSLNKSELGKVLSTHFLDSSQAGAYDIIEQTCDTPDENGPLNYWSSNI